MGAGAGRAWLVYTGLRLLLFLGTAGLLVVLGLHGYPLLLTALLISSVLSLFVLRRHRDRLVAAQHERAERRAGERALLRSRLDDSQLDDSRLDDSRLDGGQPGQGAA